MWFQFSADWIQAAVALLLLGGMLGGFGAELYRRHQRRDNGASVMRAVLEDQQGQREDLWARIETIEQKAETARVLAREAQALCASRLDSLEVLCAQLSIRLADCLAKVEGEQHA